VELQDFALQHLFSRLELAETQGAIIDRRGATADAMSKHLGMSNVLLQPTAAEVTSEDGLDKFRIGIAQVYASLGSFNDFEDACVRTRDFFEMAADQVSGLTVRQVEIRSWDIAPVDSFEALRDRLAEKLLGSAKEIAGIVGSRLTDAGWTLEFREDDSSVSVRFGPMQSAQLRSSLQGEQGADSDYPANFLFLEVYREVGNQTVSGEHALDWWKKVMTANRAMSEHIGGWLKEKIV
jgi:hypothetical protein